MTSPTLHDAESVHGYISKVCFKTGPPTRVGAEVEWILNDLAAPTRSVPLARTKEALARTTFPGGATLTFEPGGQVELSSPVAEDLDSCWRGLSSDVSVLLGQLGKAGLAPAGVAVDPHRSPQRQIHTPRYDCMEAYFASLPDPGSLELGVTMMTCTAAVQINLDAGADTADVSRRWHLLHALGPTMVGAFANSPYQRGRLTGWKSTRQRVWRTLDPSRTAAPVGPDPATAWAKSALTAPVMMLSRGDTWQAAPGLTFGDWVEGRAELPPPTEDDLARHLTTLFPPVRPRGWFEVRYVDAQTPDRWAVPVAVLAGILGDDQASALAATATRPVSAPSCWETAARTGLDDPGLARAATEVFHAALDALRRRHTDPALIDLVQQHLDHYVLRGRCPADDRISTPTWETA